MTTLLQALDARFTDMSELMDISNHGIDTGIHGFIYNDEIVDFYDDHEDDILDVINELGFTPNNLIKDPGFWNVQEIKVRATWIAVESYAHDRVEAHLETQREAIWA